MSAADSLILADVVELLGGGVTSSHPLCPGAQITLVGFDFGSPMPQTEVISSLLLDGERPTGRRASNRQISLPIQIRGPSRAIMDGARELLQQLTDADTWRLTWTPDPGSGTPLPLIFDCFRATTTVSRDLVLEDNLVSQLTITFPALPYGRSDTLTTLVFPSPSVSWPLPAQPIKLDDYGTVSSSTQPTWWSQSTQHVTDSFSAHWSWAVTDLDSGPFYTRTLPATVDITGLSKLTWQFGLGTSNYSRWHKGNVTFAVTLTDNAAHTLSFGGSTYCTASNSPGFPSWTQVTFAIPTSATFDYTHLNSYSIKAWRFIDTDGDLELDSDAYINGLTATAAALNPFAAVRGTLYQIGAPGGTARAPMSAQFQSPPVTVPTTVTFNTAGPFTWTAPGGVTAAAVSVKGATGQGGNRTTSGAGGGAGGGAGVTHATYTVVPGQTYSGIVGAAGGAGGFPTLTASYNVGQDGLTGADFQTPSFTPAAGEVLVCKVINDFYSHTLNTPTGGGLTWTRNIDNAPANGQRVAIFTATVGGGGTPMTVTQSIPGTTTQIRRMVVERWGNAKLAGSPALMTSTGSGAPSGTCTTAANNSVVTWCNADLNLATGTRTYRSSAVEVAYSFSSGNHSWYWAYQNAATAGAQTVGLTAPAGQAWNMCGLEVQALNTGALTDGGDSSFDGTAFYAVGGKSVPLNTATGGAGGLSSASTVPAGGSKFSGGNGFTGTTTGGGAGSSAGDALAGVNAVSQTGATAPSGGISGGNGGAAGGNNGGSVPGGGAFSIGGSASGAAGAAGKVTVTYTPPLSAFKTLVAHAPSYTAPSTLQPLIPVGAGQDTPNGSIEYPVTSPVAALPARYYGTYTVVAVASVVNTPSAARTLTIGFKQYDYLGGPSTTRTVARTLTPSTETPVITNGFVVVGEISLPCRDIALDNSTAFTTVTVTDTNTSDRWLDLLVLDVRGQLLAVNSATGHVNYFYDEPDIDRDWGRILASDFDRPQATSVLDANDMILSGGPLVIDPNGPGWFLCYSPDAGAPGLTATFYSRWRDSRLS